MYIYIYNRKWAFKIFNQAVRNLKLTVASSSLYMYIRYAVFHRWRNICDTFEARPRLVVNARRWRQLPWRVLSGALVEQIDSQTPWHLAPQPRDPLEKEKVWIPGGEESPVHRVCAPVFHACAGTRDEKTTTPVTPWEMEGGEKAKRRV